MKRAMNDSTYSAAEHGLGGASMTILSDRPHASLLKAASLVGIGRSNVCPHEKRTGVDSHPSPSR